MDHIKPVISAPHNSISENIEYNCFSLNSVISVRKLNDKGCSQEKLEYIFPIR